MSETLKSRLRGARRSLTIWFNSLSGSVLIILPVAQDAFPQMQAYIPAHIYQIMMGGIVAANIALRFHTTIDLKDK